MSSDVLVNVGKSILMSETCVKRNLSRKAYIIFVTNATNVVSVKFSPKYEKFLKNAEEEKNAQFGMNLRTVECKIFRPQKTLV